MFSRLLMVAALALSGCSKPERAEAAPEEVVYCRNGGEVQKLDLYKPDKPGPGKGLVV